MCLHLQSCLIPKMRCTKYSTPMTTELEAATGKLSSARSTAGFRGHFSDSPRLCVGIGIYILGVYET